MILNQLPRMIVVVAVFVGFVVITQAAPKQKICPLMIEEEIDEEERSQLLEAILDSYHEQQDIRYGAARGWVDRIIEPHRTREELAAALQIASTFSIEGEYRTGVLQT